MLRSSSSRRKSFRWGQILAAGGLAAGLYGVLHVNVFAQQTQTPAPHSQLSSEILQPLQRMGETLRASDFSFQVRTIRAVGEEKGDAHIFHTMKVLVHRPDRVRIDVNGDDGQTVLAFDGKEATLYTSIKNVFTKIPVPEGTLQGMLGELVGRLDVDLPLADFLAENPHSAFLSGVENGRLINTITIGDKLYDHFLLVQPPGIQLELWLAKEPPVVPKRLIVTYTHLPGSPSFIALFSDWNFNVRPSPIDFKYDVPADATQVELKAPAK